jgi:hypothetical protein
VGLTAWTLVNITFNRHHKRMIILVAKMLQRETFTRISGRTRRALHQTGRHPTQDE